MSLKLFFASLQKTFIEQQSGTIKYFNKNKEQAKQVLLFRKNYTETFLNCLSNETNLNIFPLFPDKSLFKYIHSLTVCNFREPSEGSPLLLSLSPEGVGPPPLVWKKKKKKEVAYRDRLGYYSVFMVPSCVVRPKRRPRVKALCKIYVHAAVSVGGKINIASLMHGDDWVLSDWQ